MNDNLVLALPAATARALAHPSAGARLSRPELLATTGLLAAIDPKLPRLAGD